MMRYSMIILTMVFNPLALFAEEKCDPLQALVQQSDVVVAGLIKSVPQGVSKEEGVLAYIVAFQITEVLYQTSGQKKPMVDGPERRPLKKGAKVKVNIVRFEKSDEERPAMLKKGGDCLLFLKWAHPNKPVWETVDPWFGIQRRNFLMEEAIKTIHKEQQAQKGE